jgi:hypothetical protein
VEPPVNGLPAEYPGRSPPPGPLPVSFPGAVGWNSFARVSVEGFGIVPGALPPAGFG